MSEQPEKKRRKVFGATPALAGVSQSLQAVVSGNELHAEDVPLSRIQPDPANPRQTGLDPGNPESIAADDPLREEKLRTLEGIRELSVSIADVGVIQPINIYRHGDGFRIATGERRFLASLIAGKHTIPAVISDQKPKNLRLIQLVENIHRVDLPLWHRVENIRAVMEERAEQGEAIDSAEILQSVIGFKRTTAYNLWALLHAPEDVQEVVRSDAYGTLQAVAKVARIEDAEERKVALQKLGTEEPEDKARPRRTADAKDKGGRPKTSVNLGRVSFGAARAIAEALLPKTEREELDSEDPYAIEAALKKHIQSLEKGK